MEDAMATETLGETASTCVVDGSAVGMPQLCFDWWPNQIFWLMVTLAVIFFFLSRVALPRIASVLAERQGSITNDLAAAEDLKARALEAEDAYNKALAEARSEAQKIIAEAKADLDDATAKADAEIAAKLAESEKKIAETRASAMEAVKGVAKDTAGELVAAMGTKADARTITAAVNARMKG